MFKSVDDLRRSASARTKEARANTPSHQFNTRSSTLHWCNSQSLLSIGSLTCVSAQTQATPATPKHQSKRNVDKYNFICCKLLTSIWHRRVPVCLVHNFIIKRIVSHAMSASCDKIPIKTSVGSSERIEFASLTVIKSNGLNDYSVVDFFIYSNSFYCRIRSIVFNSHFVWRIHRLHSSVVRSGDGDGIGNRANDDMKIDCCVFNRNKSIDQMNVFPSSMRDRFGLFARRRRLKHTAMSHKCTIVMRMCDRWVTVNGSMCFAMRQKSLCAVARDWNHTFQEFVLLLFGLFKNSKIRTWN